MILGLFKTKPRVADPGWRAPHEVIEQIATLTRERDEVRQFYAAAGAEVDQLRKTAAEALAEAAELRHLPEKVRLLEGSVTRAQARAEDLARQLRLAREHLDRCPTAITVSEEDAAKRYADGLGDGA